MTLELLIQERVNYPTLLAPAGRSLRKGAYRLQTAKTGGILSGQLAVLIGQLFRTRIYLLNRISTEPDIGVVNRPTVLPEIAIDQVQASTDEC